MTAELLGEEWYNVLKEEFDKQYFKDLMSTVSAEYGSYKILPKPLEVFSAFKLTTFTNVKVVIIGQDPYPNDHAHGLSFSSQKKETPPSLRVILREIDRSIWKTTTKEEYLQKVSSNNLTCWAKQGVLLLNSILTVRAGVPGSHDNIGWQKFTSKALETLWNDASPKVFVLWGHYAQLVFDSILKIDERNHVVLVAGHPATAAHGNDLFSGNNHFLKINKFLGNIGQDQINWEVHESSSN